MNILLSSAFKPFGIDNAYGRKGSQFESFHNQLTLKQGVFSIRSFATTNGLHAIASNIATPTTVLDSPTLRRYLHEIKKGYDIIGIGTILPNYNRLKKMVALTREVSPGSKLIIGGFCTMAPNIENDLDVDDICRGEGIRFMRNLLGLPEDYQFRNPHGIIAQIKEIFGVPLNLKGPQLVVGLGCTYGCDFCCTSHFFGKKHIQFYATGRALFQELKKIYQRYPDSIIPFMGDDNFLIDLERAEELRRCLIEENRLIKSYIFATADKIIEFGVEKLAEMGVEIIWIGRESKFSDYKKNSGIDYRSLISELRQFGIKPIVSSLLLTDKHTPENIMDDIQDHINAKPVFSQFLFYSPVPGTPLYERLKREGRINNDLPYEDYHGLCPPLINHPAFSSELACAIQDEAYMSEYQQLGPSIARYIETDYIAWLHLRNTKSNILKLKAAGYEKKFGYYRIILSAIERLAPEASMAEMAKKVRCDIESHFGKTTAVERAAASGLFLTGCLRNLRTRYFGDVMQPPTIVTHYNQP